MVVYRQLPRQMLTYIKTLSFLTFNVGQSVISYLLPSQISQGNMEQSTLTEEKNKNHIKFKSISCIEIVFLIGSD